MDEILKYVELAPLGLFVVAACYLVKLFVRKSLNHDLDIVLTPSWQVFVEQLITVLVFSLLFSVIILLEMVDYHNITFEKSITENNGFFETFFLLYLVTGIYVSLFWFIIKALTSLLCNKKVFRTKIKGETWKIDQTYAKNILYLSIGDRKLKHVYNEDIEIITEYHQSEKGKKIYGSIGNIEIYRTVGMILSIVIIFFNVYFYFNRIEKEVYCLIISLFIIIPIFIFLTGFNEYELSKKEKSKNTNEEHPQD
ncbi:hypothetical protein [Lysinibacillus xylanilyticus]|uniref:hypothetical protein n=1 Tax=Lysinibacillus xylanilyticus TaxID=582475 RepID=UPI003D987188